MSVVAFSSLLLSYSMSAMLVGKDAPPAKGGKQSVEQSVPSPTRSTAVIPLQHGDPGRITKTIQSVLGLENDKSRQLVLTTDAVTRSIIVSGDQTKIDLVRNLIQTLDVPPSAHRQVKRFRLNANVNHVAEALNQAMQGLYPERASFDRPLLTPETSSNSLLVTGAESDLQLVARLISELDVVAVKKSTRMRMEVYRVQCPRAKIAALELDSVAMKAESPKEFVEALGAWGATDVMFRVDQNISLGRQTAVRLGSQLPIVNSKSTNKEGREHASISYHDIGCEINIGGGWTDGAAGAGEASFSIQVSSIAESDISVSDDVKASIFRRLKQDFSGAIKAGRPLLLMTVDATPTGETTPVLVTRIVLSLTD